MCVCVPTRTPMLSCCCNLAFVCRVSLEGDVMLFVLNDFTGVSITECGGIALCAFEDHSNQA